MVLLLGAGGGRAKGQQLAARNGHSQFAVGVRLRHAVGAGQLYRDIDKLTGVCRGFFGPYRNLQRGLGAVQLTAAKLPSIRAVGHRRQRARRILYLENCLATLCARLGDGFPVQEQFHAGGVKVDLHHGFFAVAAGPAPAGQGICAAPCCLGRFCIVVDRLHADDRVVQLAPDGRCVERLAVRVSQNVKRAHIGQQPRIRLVKALAVRRVGPCADAHLAEVVPRRPHKIADQIGVLLDHCPVFGNVLREGLTAHHHAVGVGLALQRVAAGGIVIARNVQRIQHRGSNAIGLFAVGAPVHTGADHRGNQVEHCAGHSLHFALVGIFTSAFFFIDALAVGAAGKNHQVHAAGHSAVCIKTMQIVHHLLGGLHARGLGGLGNLVADGIQNHTGVVEVPADHGLQVCHMVFLPRTGVVIFRLVAVPHIPRLVHQIDAELVARLQHGAGTGIVRATDGVVPGLLQRFHTAVLTLVIGGRAQNPAVMVEAAAAQQRFLPIDEQPLGRPFHLADAKGQRGLIAAVGDFGGVEVRCALAPQLCIGDGKRKVRALALHPGCIKMNWRIALHPDDGRGNAHRADAYALGRNAVLGAGPQPDRAVDTRAGIPAGIRVLYGTFHPHDVFAVLQKGVSLHKERNVAVGRTARQLAVDIDLGVFIHALKL